MKAPLLSVILCITTSLIATNTESPLLVVVLMVKNEETVICKTLQPFVDQGVQAYLIFDTGSTDNTVEVVRSYFKKNKIKQAHIRQEPFINFAASRNRALELAEQQFPQADFILMLDAEWYTQHVDQLIHFCMQQQHNTAHDAYLIRINAEGGQDFFIPRLMRPRAHLRFHGAIHEYLQVKSAPKLPESICFNYRPAPRGQQATKKRLERDRDILLQEHAKNPQDSRTIYFLAQTYSYMGDYETAYTYFRLCVTRSVPDKKNIQALEYWRIEQAYQASYESGVIAQELAHITNKFSWDIAFNHYFEAFLIDPKRAEPLMRIARHYWDEGNMDACFLFARQAAELPLPAHVTGLIEHEVYSFKRFELLGACAGNLGKWDVSEWALRKALEAQPGKEHLKKNLAIVLENKAKPLSVVDSSKIYYVAS